MPPSFQKFQDKWGWSDNAGFVILQRGKGKAALSQRPFLKLLVDGEAALLKIHAVPGQTDGFRQPKAGKHHNLEQRPITITADCDSQGANLCISERLDFFALHPGECDHLCRISAHIFQLRSGGEALAQNSMDVADTSFGIERLLLLAASE